MFSFESIAKTIRRQAPQVVDVISLEDRWIGQCFVITPALASQNSAGIVEKVSNKYSADGQYELYVVELETKTWATWIPLSEINLYDHGDYWQVCLNCGQEAPMNQVSEETGFCPECEAERLEGLEMFEELAFDTIGYLADDWYEEHGHGRFS